MDSIKVSDCMSRQFVSFEPEMPLVEAAVALVKNELLGGPVVDAQGHLIGWISEQDCIGAVSQVMYYEDRVAVVSDIMSKEVTKSAPDRNALDLAEDMKNHKRKIYPVVNSEDKVVGVISRRHILKEMLERITHPEAPNPQ
ncbi:CBS domain-containing protein [Pseudomaricurvus alkylphenolicus]|jgi:predicted transcriptional regulator|uniref:CBS domain-containing protein n=1 Tax=Pseudomaricurvus alkylphenolicus TaxID=1306991 RepID=UPI0014237C94|nr:CBS domain-containing protein [Pseudomaricurvus alkylphenolicus]NIB44275.1 CBS domain-containing protein [Pseudomaricurvus alkylphenolicus]